MFVELLCVEPTDGEEAPGREDFDAAALLPVEGVRTHGLAFWGSGALLHQDGGQLRDTIISHQRARLVGSSLKGVVLQSLSDSVTSTL